MNNPSFLDALTLGLFAALCGCFLWVYYDQKREIRYLQDRLEEMEEEEKEPATRQLPMPGMQFTVGRVRVSRFDIDDKDAPEWVKQLLSDPTHPGPEPTHAELQESLFAEIERLGINIPE